MVDRAAEPSIDAPRRAGRARGGSACWMTRAFVVAYDGRERSPSCVAINRRGASMDTIKPLFTASASVTGGRNGRAAADDGSVAVELSVPKAMGGPGKTGTTTPEHLFAAGYAACFGGALDFVASQHKKNARNARVHCAVSIGPRDAGGFGLAVRLRIEDRSLPQGELAALVEEAHEKICPYSHATRNNVAVEFEVQGA
jgi:lipoyl-dependent peroxiredoxin